MDLRPLVPESYSVDQFSATPSGVLIILSNVVQFQYKNSKIVQIRSLTIIDHQNSGITILLLHFLYQIQKLLYLQKRKILTKFLKV